MTIKNVHRRKSDFAYEALSRVSVQQKACDSEQRQSACKFIDSTKKGLKREWAGLDDLGSVDGSFAQTTPINKHLALLASLQPRPKARRKASGCSDFSIHRFHIAAWHILCSAGAYLPALWSMNGSLLCFSMSSCHCAGVCTNHPLLARWTKRPCWPAWPDLSYFLPSPLLLVTVYVW